MPSEEDTPSPDDSNAESSNTPSPQLPENGSDDSSPKAEQDAKAEATPAGSSRGRKILIAAGALFGFMILAYFVATSAFFVKTAVLPQVGSMLGSKITMDDASISPFSSVSFDNLEVVPEGEEFLAKVGSVKARYRLLDIAGGNINVDEVTVDSPTLQLIVKEDGTTNLDPILQALATDAPPPPAGETPALDVKNVTIRNATLKVIRHLAEGDTQSVQIENVNFGLDQLANGKASKIDLSAGIGLIASAADKLSAKFQGNYAVELSDDLLPKLLSGTASINIESAEGMMSGAKGLKTDFSTELTAAELKESSIQFSQEGRKLGRIEASGPIDSEKLSADLKIALKAIDKNVLNLVGALIGVDFETTTVSAESQIKLAPNAEKVEVNGKVAIDNLAVTQIGPAGRGPTTPALNLGLGYNLALDLVGQSATLNSLSLNGSNAQGEFLNGDLATPITASFGDSVSVSGDAAYKLAVNRFDLAPWKAFTGPQAPEGAIGAKLEIASDAAGENVSAKYELTFTQDKSTPLKVDGAVGYNLPASLVDLSSRIDLKLSEFKVPGAPVIPGDPVSMVIETAVKADLNASSLNVSKADVAASAGTSKVIDGKLNKPVNVTWKDQVKALGGASYHMDIVDFDLRHVQAIAGDAVPPGALNFKLDLNADEAGSAASIKFEGNMTQEGARVIDTSGNAAVDLASTAVDLKAALNAGLSKLKIAGASILPAEQNAAVKLSADTRFAGNTLTLNQLKTTLLENDEQVTSVGMTGGISLGDVIEIKDTSIQLDPTERAKNRLAINGRIKPGTLHSGNIEVRSDGLDVTPFLDYFMPAEAAEEPTPQTTKQPEEKPVPDQPDANKEPDAIQLPIEKFDLDVAIAHFYAREIAVSNYVTKVSIVGSKVDIDPVSLTFNGAPLNATAKLNLGVPGYEYDTTLKIHHLPIAPLVDTFVPEYKGKVAAEVLTDVAIKGKGVTGTSLQKNLSGYAGATLTNAAVNVLEKGIVMKSVAALLQAPEILEPPLDYLNAKAQIGEGSVEIQDFIVQSAAFQATATGKIAFDDVLTNSPLDIPVGINLSKNLAKNVKLTGVDPNAKYTALPDFVTVKGTIGAPKPDLDHLKLTAIGIQAAPAAVLNAASGVAGKAVDVTENAAKTLNKLTEGTVGGVLGALTGDKKDSKGKEKKSGGLGGLLGGLGGGKKSSSTNAPPKSSNTSTNDGKGIHIPFNPFKKK